MVTDINHDGIDELVHFDMSDNSVSEDQPDTWEMTSYRWGVDKRVIDKAIMAPPLFAAIFGSYKTLAEARSAQHELAGEGNCLASAMVVETAGFARLPPGGMVLAALTTDERSAKRVLGDASTCNASVKGTVKRIR